MAEVKLIHLDSDGEFTEHDNTTAEITFLGGTFGANGLSTIGGLDMNSTKITELADGTVSTDAATYGQLLALSGGQEWQNSVIDKDLTAPPGGESTGDRYLIGLDTTASVATGAWAGQDGNIAEYNGAGWDFITPTTGMFVAADDETDTLYLFGGTTWTAKAFESTTASTGLEKVGNDIRIDLDGTLGANLFNPFNINANGLSLKLDDASIGVNGSSQIEVKADGINDTHIDFGTGLNQVSAADLPIADSGGYFTTDFVEDALQELGADVLENKPTFTAGAGGVSAGDVVYISANDTVLPLSALNNSFREVGIAYNTAAGAADVEVISSNRIVPGCLSAATAGARQWWNGTGYQETPPSGAGNKRILGGYAKNATDLLVKLQRLTILA